MARNVLICAHCGATGLFHAYSQKFELGVMYPDCAILKCRSCNKWIELDRPGFNRDGSRSLFRTVSGSLTVRKTSNPDPKAATVVGLNTDPQFVWNTPWGRKLRKYGGFQ